jgi:8-oxo-dGTP pyrophosphatase MutT (NUDIX family)
VIKEKSVGCVTFYLKEDQRYYLLLRYISDHWGLVKGHVETNETEKQTLVREIYEETKLEEFEIIPNFKELSTYTYSRNSQKFDKLISYYLVKSNNFNIIISDEHKEYIWLKYEEAIDRVTYKNTKVILKKAEMLLKSQDINRSL